MSEEKKFGFSLFGFSKKKVTKFVEETIQGFESELQEKNNEIFKLKSQMRDLRQEVELIPEIKGQIKNFEDIKKSMEEELQEEKNMVSILKQQISDSEIKISEYEVELNLLRNSLATLEKSMSDLEYDVTMKEKDLQNKLEQLNNGRAKVTEALIFANEKAESMIDFAKTKTEEEIERRNRILASDRKKYTELISFIKMFREQAASTFKFLDESIVELIESNEYDNSPLSLERAVEKQNISYPVFVKSGT